MVPPLFVFMNFVVGYIVLTPLLAILVSLNEKMVKKIKEKKKRERLAWEYSTQNDPTKDAFNIINKIFLDRGAEIAKLDLLPSGEMKVTVKHDLR